MMIDGTPLWFIFAVLGLLALVVSRARRVR